MATPLPSSRCVVAFIASAEDDLATMPQPVKDVFGFAIFQAELGGKHPDAKPLKVSAAPAFRRWWRITMATPFAPSTS